MNKENGPNMKNADLAYGEFGDTQSTLKQKESDAGPEEAEKLARIVPNNRYYVPE